MVSALDSGVSGPGLSSGRGHCVVFLGKTLYSQKAYFSRAMPQLTGRLEEANLFLVTHVSIIFRPKSFSGRE